MKKKSVALLMAGLMLAGNITPVYGMDTGEKTNLPVQETTVNAVLGQQDEETIGFDVTVEWDDCDNKDNDRPQEVEIGVKRSNGQVVEGQTLVLSEQNGWSGRFEGLEKYDANNKEIRYYVYSVTPTITDEDKEGYAFARSGDVTQGFTCTFTKSVVLNIDVQWDDGKNITGVRGGSYPYTILGGRKTLNINRGGTTYPDDEVYYIHSIQPKYKLDGTKCDYTVKGGVLSGAQWESSREPVTPDQEGKYVLNYRLPIDYKDVTVEVKWDDGNNADGIRPDKEISIPIIQDRIQWKNPENTRGVKVSLNEDNGYQEVLNVPYFNKYKGGSYQTIDYGIKELTAIPQGYEVSYSTEQNENQVYPFDTTAEKPGITITLTHKVPRITVNIDGKEEVLFVANGGALGEQMPEDPVKDGYRFLGWNTQETGEGEWITDTTTFDQDTTIYAVFERIPEEVSTAVLEYALELADKAETEGVIDSVVERFENAKTNAQAILDKVNAGDASVTQSQIDDAWRELIEVMQYLSFKQGDKEDLEKVIALAETMEQKLDSYVEEGKQEFIDALAEARTVYDDGDAMQDEVDASWTALLEAMANLRLKANKDALEGLVNGVESMNLDAYTKESAEVFRTALANAKSVLEDETLSEDNQAKVDAAVKQLASAKDGLKAKQASTGDVNTDNQTDKGNSSTADNKADNNKNSADTKTTTKSVKTGDATQTATWMVLLAAAGSALVAAKKRKDTER
ncbi:Cna B-type domain-containing protein [Lachnoclostridium sp. An181]|uniref:Cna B-type domain-containing protein n=1 Tax=Lachnoclostridium sp. An181 TaxID=1965575 RepID=UPI000B37F873|nr:Cna B-type domain-containing protein [Lachnoclostridium sp. An181]OUP48075.1 hypothetical protein B5F18_11830 [Lachnoclostridium sp. An181]